MVLVSISSPVFNVLVDVAENGNWGQAFAKHIPTRFKISYKDDRAKRKAELEAAKTAAVTAGQAYEAQPAESSANPT